jgi:hypothetical protein
MSLSTKKQSYTPVVNQGFSSSDLNNNELEMNFESNGNELKLN